MQIELNPKAMFQQQEKLASAWRSLVSNDDLQEGILYALAEYSMVNQPGASELAAIKGFLDTLLNLGEKDAPAPTFPSRTLSYGHPSKDQPQKK